MKLALFSTTALLALSAPAQDWTQWGGTPYRNMYSPTKGLPDRFDPGKLKKGTEQFDPMTQKNVKCPTIAEIMSLLRTEQKRFDAELETQAAISGKR